MSISTIHKPATDLGFLLHKNPNNVHSAEFGFGTAHVLYPVATDDETTASVIVDVDPVGLVRNRKNMPSGNDFSLAQYVNDRPYAASSFLSVAIGKLFGTAMTGRSKERPELADSEIPLRIDFPVLPCRGGEAVLRRIFEPLGYEVEAEKIPLDEQFPAWGDSRYLKVTLNGNKKVKAALEHLFVLIPVLDDDKHYWVGAEEVEKLLRRGGDWLASHPEREFIAHRYLRRDRRLVNEALARLLEDTQTDPDVTDADHNAEEEVVEQRISLNELRLAAVNRALHDVNARTVLDLGCGEGKLIRELLKESQFEKVVGVDVSYRSLEIATKRLHLDTMAPRQRDRVDLLHGSLTYRDKRLDGFDAAALVEVIEHLDQPRLYALERSVFTYARPRAVIVTTPNSEYNVRFESLPAGKMRHKDHRFEWSREQFQAWANRIAETHEYRVSFRSVGDDDPEVGSPTQMAVFER